MPAKTISAIVMIASLLASGCTGSPLASTADAGDTYLGQAAGADGLSPSQETPQTSTTPWGESANTTGIWDGTHLRMRMHDIDEAMVWYVSLTSGAKQDCRMEFETRGNISQAHPIAWSSATFDAVVGVRSFSHEMVRDPVLSATSGSTNVTPYDGGQWQTAYGKSGSTIGTDSGRNITYYLAASYPDGGDGWATMELHCPAGVQRLRTGWSTTAFLLADTQMAGARAAYNEPGVGTARIQGAMTWNATMAAGKTLFRAHELSGSVAVLETEKGAFSCGPSPSLAAVEGESFCQHAFDGGPIQLTLTPGAQASVDQSPTIDAWMALLAQMEYRDWSRQP